MPDGPVSYPPGPKRSGSGGAGGDNPDGARRAIAIVIPGFQADEGDWCIPAFSNLAREMAGAWDVHVFALRYPAGRRDYRVGSVRVRAIGGGAFLGRRLPVASLLDLWRAALADIATEHRRTPFSAIMGVWATESGFLATRAAKRLHIPSVVHLAGGELVHLPDIGYGNSRPGLASALVSVTLKSADLLTVPSTPIARLLSLRGVPPKRLRRWALGVDAQMFSPDPTSNEEARPFTFLSVGSLIAVKGFPTLIEACAMLRAREPAAQVRLLIAGGGPLRNELLQLVHDLSLEGYVVLAGDVPHGHLPDLIRRSDCFLLGSRHEAQCMAALEAMACAIPWVAPPVGALADCALTGPGEVPSGLLVPRASAEAFAARMNEMLNLSAEQRSLMGAAARQRVLRDYNLESQTAALIDIFAGLTARQSPATIPRSRT